MKVLMIDNYDSFTYNIVHYLEILGAEVEVFRNDKISLDSVEQYDKIVLSPGPGLPQNSGILLDLIEQYAPTKSILGICLGQQAIGEAFGAELYNLKNVVHGKPRKTIVLKDDLLFKDIPHEFQSGRYHSWAIKNLPESIELIAEDEEGVIQAIRHKKYDVRGIQFHPESIMTEYGLELLANWLNAKR
ncbi:MAG TPA: aminodeoxychorismate/anthranilate synthase component II [Chitinophagales bacterium]|nr:aminodeoxychorismate/anthranilate synthase component II [Chitinophagales bacterium]